MTDFQYLLDRTEHGKSIPMVQLMNQHVLALADGTATVTALPEQKFDNAQGRTHGGFVATLIDTVMGYAVATKLPEGTGYGTIDLNVKFVRKIDVDTGLLTATATVLHAGRTMLTANARVVDAAGKLYAHGSGSFLVYPKQAS
jgi:acyl-CoA thioesterase